MDSWIRKIPWRRDRVNTPVFLCFPGGSDGKGSACNAGDLGSITGLGRSPGGGHGNPLQYSCLENGQIAWQAIINGVRKSQTQLVIRQAEHSTSVRRSCMVSELGLPYTKISILFNIGKCNRLYIIYIFHFLLA